MMFMATTPMGGAPMASALTGAPGAVLLYGLIGAMVWPNGAPEGCSASAAHEPVGGPVAGDGVAVAGRGGRRERDNQRDQRGPVGDELAEQRAGLVRQRRQGQRRGDRARARALSAVIGVAVAVNWRPKLFLMLAIGLNLLYWVVGRASAGSLGRRDRSERRACCSSCSRTRCTRWCRTNNRLQRRREARTPARSPCGLTPEPTTKFDS